MNNWTANLMRSSTIRMLRNIYFYGTKLQKDLMAAGGCILVGVVVYLAVGQSLLEDKKVAIEAYQNVKAAHQTFFSQVVPAHSSVPPVIALNQTKLVLQRFSEKAGFVFDGATVIKGKGVQFTASELSFKQVALWLKDLADSKITISEYDLVKVGNGTVNVRFVVY